MGFHPDSTGRQNAYHSAGLMGYFGIPIKPSTILVFSIAFGISVDDTIHLPAHLGLRHRAAISMTMETDAIVVTVSEETGKISYFKGSEIKTDVSNEALFAFLIKEFMINKN